jgi:hypothetical protein
MKVTPEIKKYIYDNNTLSSRALAGSIESKFNIKIGHVTLVLDLKCLTRPDHTSLTHKSFPIRRKTSHVHSQRTYEDSF